jgi:flagellar biosynthesis protein
MLEEANTEKEKKRLFAAALKYKANEDVAPKLVAKGKGLIAEKIIALAQEHNIPIKEDPDLVQALMKLELNQFIPPELYQVVAEILAFIYRMNDKYRETKIKAI